MLILLDRYLFRDFFGEDSQRHYFYADRVISRLANFFRQRLTVVGPRPDIDRRNDATIPNKWLFLKVYAAATLERAGARRILTMSSIYASSILLDALAELVMSPTASLFRVISALIYLWVATIYRTCFSLPSAILGCRHYHITRVASLASLPACHRRRDISGQNCRTYVDRDIFTRHIPPPPSAYNAKYFGSLVWSPNIFAVTFMHDASSI